MIIVKKWVGALAMVALCATTSLLFTACGGGDGDSGSSSGGGYSYEEPDYTSQLMGLWSGKGTNWDDETLNVSVNFSTSTTGWFILSTKPSTGYGAFTSTDFSDMSVSGSYITMTAKNTYVSSVRMRITSGSIASGKITVAFSCDYDRFCGTVELTKQDDGDSSSGSASTGEQKLGSTKAYIVRMVKTSSGTSYSTSSTTCYKTKDSSGNVYLYSNSTYSSRLGKATSNSLSTWGGYSVRSYDYLVRYNVSLSHSTYYFFN